MPRRGSRLERRAPLRAMSDKRRSELAARARVRAFVLERDGGCRARSGMPSRLGAGPCFGPVDVHEILPRGRGGDWLDATNCIALCRGHHEWTHHYPALAKQVGLLR